MFNAFPRPTALKFILEKEGLTLKKICQLKKKYDIGNCTVFGNRKVMNDRIFVFLQMINKNIKGEVKK
jgi:hypothetical protein